MSNKALMKDIVSHIRNEADLIQSFCDKAEEELEKFTDEVRAELLAFIKTKKPKSPDEAAAFAACIFILENP